MGILEAAGNALGGALADQWLDYFYCDSLDQTLLCVRGRKRVGERSANTKGSDDVISDGSVIALSDGQCAIVMEMGKVIDLFTQPGENKFRSKNSGSVFSGGGLGSIAHQTAYRVGFGGDVPISQRVLYLNMKEIPNIPFSLRRTVLLRDRSGSFELTADVNMAGVFSFHITDPLLFHQTVCRNAAGTVTVESVSGQLQEEFRSAAGAALAEICAEGITTTALSAHTEDLCRTLAERVTAKWAPLRGLGVVSIAIDTLQFTKADLQDMQQLERAKALSDPTLAAAVLIDAQTAAMRAASQNGAGATAGVSLFGGDTGVKNPLLQKKNDAPRLWRCACGALSTAKYCEACGAKQPEST